MGRRHEGHDDEVQAIGDEHEMQTEVWREEKARRRAARAEREARIEAEDVAGQIRGIAQATLEELPRMQRHLTEIVDRLAVNATEEAAQRAGYVLSAAASLQSLVEGLHLCLGREAGRRGANARGNDQ